MEASKVKPLGNISRDDVRHTLHTHFHSSKPAPRPSTGGGAAIPVSSRKRVFSFVQVQKPKTEAESKRLFGSAANAGRYFVLCVTIQDANNTDKRLELHYVLLMSNLSVDVRNSWNLSKLDTIEHNGIGPEKPKGAFALFFSEESTSWPWLVEPRESATAMHEFLWSLGAIMAQNKTTLPRFVRINIEELHETATRLTLQKVYDLDIDLVQCVAKMKKNGSEEEDSNATEESGKKTTESHAGIDVSGLRLASPESNEALSLLNEIDWSDVQLSAVEENLRKKLRALEDENIAFLLSLDGESAAPSAKNNSNITSVDKILEAIDAVQNRITLIQDWTDESDEYLGQTSSSMKHFEALNNQLEMHFKNSVALEKVLAKVMSQVDVSNEHMRIFTSPVDVFPGDVAGSTSGVMKDKTGDVSRDVGVTERVRTAIAAIAAMDQAIKSTNESPASEMAALRARGDELARLAWTFGEKLCGSFESFLQRKIKQLPNARGGDGVRGRDVRELSSVTSGSDEMNWSFSNDALHNTLVDYQSLFAHVHSLDPRILVSLRQTYSKQLAGIYNAHALSLFRCLRDRLPRTTKHHFHKPTSIQSRAISLSSSFFSVGDTMCAAPLLQQALDHLTPLILREQRLVASLFFPATPSTTGGKHEPEDLTFMMENVFEKLLKRMNEFGDAAGTRNTLDALSLVVLVNGKLEACRQQSAFLYNVMVSFQLQMKRMLIKFTEDQEAWIIAQSVDTKMAGVLGPTKKIVNLIARMEESVAGKSSDSTLVSIYNMIVPATMHWIDKVADTRPKYAPLTRLENFLFLSDNLKNINPSKDLPLAQYAVEAHERYTENLQRYVASVWEYAFKQLVVPRNNCWDQPMIASIESLMATVPAAEIQYHLPRQDVRRVLDSTASTFEKSVRVMHDRLKKHFRENSKMLPSVWKQLVAYGSSRMAVYALVAGDCYQLRFEPSPERGLELLNKFAFS